MPSKKQDILELAKLGGKDAELFILDKLHALQEAQEKAIEGIKEAFKEGMTELKSAVPNMDEVLKSVRGKQGEQGIPGVRGERGESGYTPLKGKDYFDGKNGLDGRNGVDGRTPVKGVDYFDGEKGKDGANGSPDTPEEVRDKLESLVGDERLDKDAIKGLKDMILELVAKNTAFQVVGGAKNATEYTDLTSFCDGATKQFYIPKRRVIAIFSSSFPFVLRPVIDYSAVNGLLTLTAEVAAPETSSTLIVLHSRL